MNTHNNIKIPVGYKNTELGVIPEDWEVKVLDEIAILKLGKKPTPIADPKWYDFSSKIGWTQIKEMTKSYKYLYHTSQNFSSLGISKSLYIPINTILMSISSTLGKVVITKKEVGISNHIISFFKPKPNHEYLYYQLQYREKDWANKANGTAQQELTLQTIKNTSIIIAPIKEQERIATVLSDIDELIISLMALIKKKEQILESSINAYVTGALRISEFAFNEDGTPKGTKYTELGEIPEDWQITTFKDIVKINRGKTLTPITDENFYDLSSKISFVKVADVAKTYKYLTDTKHKLSSYGVQKSYLVSSNNILLSAYGTIGKIAINTQEICISGNIFVFQKKDIKIDIELLYYYLLKLEKYWYSKSFGTAQKYLYISDINAQMIAIPKIAQEQEAIATFLSTLDDELIGMNKLLSKYKQMKESMMEQLLTGKIRLL